MIYDAFSTDYDRFVNWHARLAAEMPFLENQLKKAGARSVLDAACGTGMHVIALTKLGFNATGADLSAGMIERARFNAAASGLKIQFESVGFGELQHTFGVQTFDAIICLGNSLPHLLTPESLNAAMKDFADCLRPGGILITQNRNFDSVIQKRERWMEPQSAHEGQTEWLFLRFYDFDPDGLITFHVVSLRREGSGTWSQSDMATSLMLLLHDDLISAFETAGFNSIACFGDLTGTPFDPKSSANLVVIGRLPDK